VLFRSSCLWDRLGAIQTMSGKQVDWKTKVML